MRGTQTFGGGSAVATSYDNSTSGLTATNVQAAIDEISAGGRIASTLVTIGGTGVTFTNTARFRRNGKWVEASYVGNLTVSSGSENTYIQIGDIPYGYRPLERFVISTPAFVSASKVGDTRFRTPSDNHTLYFQSTFVGTQTAEFLVTYMTGDSWPQ